MTLSPKPSGASSYYELTSVGIFKNGIQDGPVWKFLIGGSFLFGVVKNEDSINFDTFTTDNGAYINTDYSTGYVGVFEDGKMIKSQRVEISGQTEVDQVKIHCSTSEFKL